MEKRPVAYQIYSAREEAAQDLNAVLATLKELGYDGVEFAGFYGLTAEAVKEMLDQNGLVALSSHVPFAQIEADMFGVIAYHQAIGCKYIAVPYLDDQTRPGAPGFAHAIAVIDNSRQAVYGYDQRAEVFGSKGMAATANDTLSSMVLSNAEGVTGEKPLYFFLERYMQSFATEIKGFIHAIENDTDTPVGVEDGLKPVRMGLAAKKSVLEHRPVKLSEIEY